MSRTSAIRLCVPHETRLRTLLTELETQKAMQVIGLTPDEQNSIFRMLAIILWLGNVVFEEMDDGNSKIDDPNVTEFVAYLIESDADLVAKVLTTRVVETGGRRGSQVG